VQENICCLNTSVIFFLLANRMAELDVYLKVCLVRECHWRRVTEQIYFQLFLFTALCGGLVPPDSAETTPRRIEPRFRFIAGECFFFAAAADALLFPRV
jgi:hypothetical protein